MTDKAMYLCPECQIGHLQAGAQTYVRVVDGLLISLPGMPALTCDVCGYTEFEPSALVQLDALVGQGRRPSTEERPAGTRTTTTPAKRAQNLKR